MLYFLYVLFFLSCIVLVGSVLLQPGKTDAGALFTSNVSSAAFAPRGTATVLSKITIGAACVFMLSALFIAMPAFTGNISVLNTTTADAPAETSTNAADANSNTAPDANSNVAATDANANTAANANTSTNSNSNTASNSNTKKPEIISNTGNSITIKKPSAVNK